MRKRNKPADGSDDLEASSPAASLTRGLDILRAFTAGDTTLGNQDLIDRTGLPKATVSRLTSTLVGLGYLHYDSGLGRYSIGPATVSLGYSTLSSSAVVALAQPLIQELADETGAAVAIGMRDGLDMVYVANCRSMSPVTLRLNIGSRIPMGRTAMGMAWLADAAAEKRESLLEAIIAADPAHEAQIRKVAAEAVHDLSTRGFIGVFGAWYSYINAVGVCLRPSDGSPVVALTCGGIVDILPRDLCLEKIGPMLVAVRNKIEDQLNNRGARAAS
jgi:DNA-binding IclR family transcriptional regulator